MKAEIIQNVMTFETDGINLLAVMMDNYELELLEGVLEIAVEETTGKNKDSLQKILEEISTFRINKKALEERSSDRIRNLEFFLLPKGPGEVRFQSQKEGDPEQVFMFNREEIKLLPFLRQFLFTDKLVSWDRPAGRSQETKRPPGTLPSAFYIPIPDGAFPGYNTSYNPLFCDITPNHCLMVRDKASRI